MLKRKLSGLALYALLGSATAHAGQFLQAPQYPTGTNPQAIAVGDFNGDGNLDLAVANGTSNTVSILLGNGNGTFKSKVDYATGKTPLGVAVGDFNRDGYLDIAVTNSASNTVSVLLGNGDGTFKPKVDYATGHKPQGIAVADLRGDGFLDIVVTNSTDGTVEVHLGNGNGTFKAGVTYATGSAPSAIAIGDFNGDSIADLAVANSASSTVSVLLGVGDGTFRTQTQFVTGATPIAIALADFNGDGNLDIALADQNGVGACILLGKGNGLFQTRAEYATAASPTGIAVGDFTGNGTLDLAVSAGGGNSVSVLWGKGDGTFQGYVDAGAGNIPSAVVVADFDNDGKSDVVVANSGGNTVSVILSNGNKTFQTRTDYPAGATPYSIAAADFNGDGVLDLAVANNYCPSFPDCGEGTITILLGNANGTFQGPVQYSTGPDTDPTSIAVGDFNGDGVPDLAVANNNPNTLNYVSVLLGNGDGTFQTQQDFLVQSGPGWVALGDFNGDGKLDLAVTNFNSNSVSILLGNGDGTFQNAVNYTVGNGPVSVAVGDFSGDHKLDLVVVNESDNTASILLGNGDGTFKRQVTYATGAGGNPLAVVVGDFKGNGILDLAVANNQTQQVSVLLGNGDGTFQPAKGYPTGANPVSIVTADFNGDGKVDLVLTSTPLGSSPGNLVSLLLGNGDGTFGSSTLYGTGSQAYSAAVGDFNGDGAPDLAVANGGSNTVSILLNTRDTTMSVVSSGSPSVFGQSVTVTTTLAATIANGNVPTGTVTLKNGNIVIGSGTLVGGQSSVSTTTLPVGSDSLSAVYSGDGNYQPNTVGLTQTVQMAGTTTTLVSSGNPSNSSQLITFTATVISDTTGTPTGTVTFLDGIITIGSSAVNGSGVATLSISTLSVGTHNITATYDGDGNFNTSTSPVLSQLVQKASTSTAVSSSLNPSTLNQSVILTAKLSWSITGTPTGTVTFLDGTITIGNSAMNGSGVATLSISTLSVGTHNITAAYNGDGNFNASTSSVLSQVVQQGNTSTALISSANPSTESQSVQFTATVSSGAGVAPTGTVKLMDGTTQVGSSALNGSEIATFSITNLSVGTHSMTAFYSGDSNSDPSTSPVLSQTVQKANTSTALIATPTAANLNQAVTFTATVTSGTAGTPTGAVNFLDGTTQLGTSTLNGSGVATFSTSTLTAGTHNIAAAYNGDGNFNVSSSTIISLPVAAPDFSISANALSPSSVAPGASAKATITVNLTGGLNPSSLALACSVAPVVSPPVTCSLGPVSMGANNTGTSTLTVATAGPQVALSPAAEHGSGMRFALGLMIPAILLSGAGLNKPSRRKLLSFCFMFLMLGGCLLLGACASSGSAPTHGGNAGTPAGPYVVTVTGSTNGIPSQTTSVSLTVQ
jgi:hypothetical protein